MSLSRRSVVAGLGLLPLAGCSGAEKVGQGLDFAAAILDIQKRHGGRIGVSAVDHATAARLSVSSDDRFAMCSVFKWVLAAAILAQVDAGKLSLTQTVSYTKSDLLEWAPVAEKHVAEGKLPIADLCGGAVSQSDNTAANLLLPLVGGPAGLTAWVRGLGDKVTQFDRTEPDLNTNIEGDPRDTTTPAAMTQLLQTVFTGTVLKPASLAQLKDWMVATTTGAKRIRASVPSGWIAGDKTGTASGAVNDVAVIWPAQADTKTKGPIFLTIFTTGGALDPDAKNQVVAEIAKLVIDVLT